QPLLPLQQAARGRSAVAHGHAGHWPSSVLAAEGAGAATPWPPVRMVEVRPPASRRRRRSASAKRCTSASLRAGTGGGGGGGALPPNNPAHMGGPPRDGWG